MKKKIFTLLTLLLCVCSGAWAVDASWWKATSTTEVTANQTYVDDALLTASTVYATTRGSETPTINGVSFTHYIQVRVDAAPSTTTPEGTVYSGSTPLVLTPKADITVVLYYHRQSDDGKAGGGYTSNSGKDLKVVDQDAPTTNLTGTLYIEGDGSGDYAKAAKTYSLTSGKTYTVWAKGTTLRLYGIKYFDPTKADPTYTFSAGTGTGEVPASATVTKGTEITLPAAPYLYKSGATFVGWNDGTSTHAVGSKLTINEDVTLTATFIDNAANLGDAATTVIWKFAKSESAPDYNLNGTSKKYVKQATIESSTIDVCMNIDATSGKFNNVAAACVSGGYAQVNSGTIFTIPASEEMVVTYVSGAMTHTDASKFDFGEDAAFVNAKMESNNLVFTYYGSKKEISFTDNDGAMWPTEISISYPKKRIGPADAEPLNTVFTETLTKNSSGDNVDVISPNTYSSVVTISGNTKSDACGDYPKGWKIDSNLSIVINVPANVTNSKITLYLDDNITSLNLKTGTADAVSTGTLTLSNWDAGNSKTGKSTTIDLASSPSAITTYTITKNNGAKNIYKLVYTYTIPSDDIALPTSSAMEGYRSFYDGTYNYVAADANTTIYVAAKKDENHVAMTAIPNIPAGTPVILKTVAGDGKVILTKKASLDTPWSGDNELEVTDGSENFISGNAYRLGAGGAIGVGFYQWLTTKAEAGIVYLPASAFANESRSISMVFEDETTGIEAISNPQETAKGTREYYNLNGQRVANPTKGLYIVNGKKVIIK